RKVFGRQVLYKDGTLDRPALARAVFSDPRKRRALEAIIHPFVKREVRRRVKKIRRWVVVVDIPLLFEAKWQGDFDDILVVWVPEKTQAARLMRRDGYSRKEAFARIRAQMPLSQKRRRADAVIDNSGRAAETSAQVKNFLDNL
ncbi:MAG: dephospho-CoA kinase, partial [Elusimicrobia bacterium RIFCSPLOWO2_01_FULL_60_11]